MKKMNCVSTMPEIMPEITDEAIIEALFAQRPYEEKVINSAFLEMAISLPQRRKAISVMWMLRRSSWIS